MFEVRAHKCGWHNRVKVRFKVNAELRFSLKITISNKHSHGSKDQGGWFTLQALKMSLFWLRVYMQWLGGSLSNEMSVSSNWVDSSENSVFCRLCLPRNLKVFALETQLLSLHFSYYTLTIFTFCYHCQAASHHKRMHHICLRRKVLTCLWHKFNLNVWMFYCLLSCVWRWNFNFMLSLITIGHICLFLCRQNNICKLVTHQKNICRYYSCFWKVNII